MTVSDESKNTAIAQLTYVKPKDVTSPRDVWQLIDIIYDGGMDKIVVALGLWDKAPVLALRWNGNLERPKGHPLLSVHPTWFVLPQMFNLPILAAVAVELYRHPVQPFNQTIQQLEQPLQTLYGTRFNRALSLIKHPMLERVVATTEHVLSSRLLA